MSNNFIKKIFETTWIKDNISTFTIIPLILGGIWQIISLSSISISYIRFFSISQQLADGLLILTIFIFIYVAYVIGLKLVSSKPILDDSEGWWKYVLYQILTYSIAGGLFIFGAKDFLIELYEKRIFNLSNLFVFIIAIITISICFIKILNALLFIIFKKEIIPLTLNDLIEVGNYRLILVILLVISIFFLNVAIDFHKNYAIPNNSINVENLLTKYVNDRKGLKREKVKIIYMNDKYIFVENGTKIEILKFDLLIE